MFIVAIKTLAPKYFSSIKRSKVILNFENPHKRLLLRGVKAVTACTQAVDLLSGNVLLVKDTLVFRLSIVLGAQCELENTVP